MMKRRGRRRGKRRRFQQGEDEADEKQQEGFKNEEKMKPQEYRRT